MTRSTAITATATAAGAPAPAPAPKAYLGGRWERRYHVFVREGMGALRPLGAELALPGVFEWGNRGAGALLLARCILIEHFGDRALCRGCAGGWVQTERGREQCGACGGMAYRLPVSCQEFRDQVIAPLPLGPRSRWEITAAQIERWAAAQRIAEGSR
jgi:hypothetical protein